MKPTGTPLSEHEHGISLFDTPSFLQALVGSTTDAVILINAQGRVVYQNPTAARISGRDNDEVIGVRYYDFVDEESHEHLHAFMKKAMDTPGLSQQGVFKIVHKSGEPVWVQGITTNFLHDPNIKALIATYHDVTDRVQMEMALAKSEANMHSILESTDDAIVFIDTNLVINSFNTKAKEIVLEELGGTLTVGKSCLSYSVPKRREVLEAAIKSIFEGKKEVIKFEIGYKKEQKTDNWYYVRMQRAVDSSGKILGLTISATDISKRKEVELALAKSEANLRTIFNNTDDGILLIDMDLKVVSFNQRAQFFAKKDLKHTLKEGDHAMSYFTSERRLFMELTTKKVLEGNNTNYEVSYVQPDGGLTWYYVRMLAVRNENGDKVLGLTMTLTDITARKEYEHSIQAMNELLDAKVQERTASLQMLNKQLAAFTYSVSHDLKMPAYIVHNMAGLLHKQHSDKLGEEGKELVGEIIKYSSHMENLIKDLLLLSKSTTVEVYKKRCNMRKTVYDAIAENIDTGLYPNADIRVGELIDTCCDSNLMKLVWLNLVSNALKYSSKQENPFITIGSKCQGESVVYYIKDNGVGFDTEHAEKVFEVFKRLHCIDDYEGTGVGLSLVKSVVERHRGKVWAESERGKGATFYFSLPSVEIAKK